MLTSIQTKKLNNLYYNQGIENVRVVHKEYGEGRIKGISGAGYIYIDFLNVKHNEIKSSIYFDDQNLSYPDLQI